MMVYRSSFDTEFGTDFCLFHAVHVVVQNSEFKCGELQGFYELIVFCVICFICVFAMILRPLTSARSYAHLSLPKKVNSGEGYCKRTTISKKSRAKNNTNLGLPSWFVLFLYGARDGTCSALAMIADAYGLGITSFLHYGALLALSRRGRTTANP